ncbi:ketoreductase [Martiniozyma asiatica (nom. inval.)]|nr:ketoreductase [Martiniozyma asiatica]
MGLSLEAFGECNLCRFIAGAAFAVGLYKLVLTTLSFGSFILSAYVLPPVNFDKYGAEKHNWAVITGASDGLGKEYAFQLAKKGFNIVLVSRTLAKLELVATEIKSKYKRDTKIVAFDASTDAAENYQLLANALASLKVSVLINNVGQSHSMPVPFLETSADEMSQIITLNNIVTLKITQLVAPLIKSTIEGDSNSRGLILTMGSFAGLVPTPYLGVYSGSKAFLQNWSNALAGELKSDKIDVELVISYLVASAMSKIRRTSWTIPSPKQFVSATLNNVGRRVGAQERFATITPYPSHAFIHWGIEHTVGVYSWLANKLNLDMHKDIRRRALKKQARLAPKKD